MSELELFESLLLGTGVSQEENLLDDDPFSSVLSGPAPSSSSSSSSSSGPPLDILSTSLSESGIIPAKEEDPEDSPKEPMTWMPQNTHWDGGETDAFLDSILTGADVVVGGGLDVLCDNTDSNSDCGSYSSSSSSSSSSMIPSPSHSSPTVITIQHDDPSSGEPHQTRLTLEDEDVVMSAPVTQSGGGLDQEEDDDPPVTLTAVNPVTNSPPELATAATPITIINSLTNTSMPHIVWPVMNKNKTHKSPSVASLCTPIAKRRRISASSNDSGLDETSSNNSSMSPVPSANTSQISVVGSGSNGQKYPPLILTDEEKRLCERENIKLPSHYPLSREEEKNLKKIRRKIRNKVSAQDSRKRKKEYVDAMEDRVRICSEENDELHNTVDQLHSKIDQLTTQNKTLAGQLKRLHQIFLNGGLKQTQTSTAMMVLLLSTALFLIPGSNKNQQTSEPKCEVDITQAIKMGPPIPGQSRSLLNFAPHGIKQEFCASPAPVSSPKNIVPKSGMENAAVSSGSSKNNYNIRAATATTTSAMATSSQAVAPKSATAKIAAAAKAGGAAVTSFSSDHDYFNNFQAINENSILVKSKVGLEEGPAPMKLVVASKRNNTMTSYIEEDAPAQGYGPGKMADNTVVEERRINVTRGGAHLGMRTVVLHVPKDIK